MTECRHLLLTGGAGFIGANFVHYWMSRHPQDVVVEAYGSFVGRPTRDDYLAVINRRPLDPVSAERERRAKEGAG